MTVGKTLRFLFVGQSRSIACDLQSMIQSNTPSLLFARNQSSITDIHFEAVTNQRDAIRIVRNNAPNVVMLETGESNGDRLHFAAKVRERLPPVRLLELGFQRTLPSNLFDAFLKLPLDTRQTLDVLQRMARPNHTRSITFGAFKLDKSNGTLTTPQCEHHLRPMELSLLEYLVTHANKLVRRIEIMRSVWETDYVGDTRTIDVHVRQLRKFLEEDPSTPKVLITERGRGYILKVEEEKSGQ